MKKQILSPIMLSIFLASFAFASDKVDPYLNLADGIVAPSVKSTGSAPDIVSVFLKMSDIDPVREYVNNHGGSVHSIIGDIVTADVPRELIVPLSDRLEVVYIESAKELVLNLDYSRTEIGARDVQSGMVNQTPYTGKGVIVGIIDSGIDWSHATFLNDKNDSRIISIWDQTMESAAGFTAPAEIAASYGIECDNARINDGDCPSYDNLGHGTHVAGIAAGSHPQYTGIAPEAELIMVKTLEDSVSEEYTPSIGGNVAFSTRVIDAARYIFAKAGALGKPAVINISMGMNFGPHDGASLFEAALDAMLEEAPGRSIVVAAGNSNNQSEGYFAGIHAEADLSGDTGAVEFHGVVSHSHGLILDIWQPSDSNVTFGTGVDDYDVYENTGFVEQGSVFDKITDNGKLRVVVDSSETNNPLNSKKHTLINIRAAEGNAGTDISTALYTFDLIATGTGHFDAWIADGGGIFAKRTGVYDETGFTYIAGDSRHSVGIPSTARNVVSVASYASRESFALLDSSAMGGDFQFTDMGDISPFSSFGPSVDPEHTGQKPEISAPGEWIISALSGHAVNMALSERLPVDLDDVKFAAMRGTSMSSPHVAGAIALLFERDATLSYNDAKLLLEKNTESDAYTGAPPNNQWGYGKLNILKAMQNFDSTDLTTPLPWAADDIQETAFVPNAVAEPVEESAADDGGGKTGCSLGGMDASFHWSLLAPFMFAVALISFTKLRRIAFLLIVMFICACGSAGGGSDAVSLTPDDSAGYGNTKFEIMADTKSAVYSSFNDELTDLVWISIPLKHFFAAEEIDIGANNLSGADVDEALFMLMKYRDANYTGSYCYDGPCNSESVLTEAWVATSGRLAIEQASIAMGSMVSASVTDAVFRKIDLSSMIIDRDGEETTYTGAIHASISNDVTEPIITEMSPLEAKYGTVVTIKGFNLNGMVGFKNCDADLPFVVISPNQIEVTINAYCNNNLLQITNGNEQADGYAITMDASLDVSETPMPETNGTISKVVLNKAENSAYFRFTNESQLHVYSIDEGAFVRTVPIPASAKTFDISADGQFIAVSSGLRIYLLDTAGNIIRTIVINQGREVLSLAFGPNHTGLASVDDWPYTKIATFDADAGTFVISEGLRCDASNVYASRSPKHETILAAGYNSGPMGCIYSFPDDVAPQKTATARIGYFDTIRFNDVAEEILINKSAYDYSLNKLYEISSDIGVWKGAYSPSAGNLVLVNYGKVNIYDPTATDIIMSGIPYADGASETISGALFSADGSNLIFYSEDNLYQIDYQKLTKWMEAE